MTKFKGRGQTDQDIIRAIGYITDDRYIASYFGVDVRRVNQLRILAGKEKAKQPTVEEQVFDFQPRVPPSHWNNDAERKWKADAKRGSAALLAALEKFFEKRLLQKQIEQMGQTNDPT